jgi:hypothetical protein
VTLAKTMYVYKVQITNKPKSGSLPKRSFQIWVLENTKKKVCVFKEVELKGYKTIDFECKKPTRGHTVIIYRDAMRRLLEKWNEVLCYVSVMAFGK